MLQGRPEPSPSHDPLYVGVLIRRAAVSGPVIDALLAHGMQPCPPDSRAADAKPPAALVCGWPGLPLADQRRRTRKTVQRHAGHRIVLITDLLRPSTLQRLLAEGIHGLVLQGELRAALAPTIWAVAAGQLCVPAPARKALEGRPLSLREREVLALVLMGQSNAEIARRLHLAESTVKSHLVSTFAKLGVRSRAEAAQVVADPQRMLSTGVIGLSAKAGGGDGGELPDG
jgi:DNA-binding NarL/FixJ family response regulator